MKTPLSDERRAEIQAYVTETEGAELIECEAGIRACFVDLLAEIDRLTGELTKHQRVCAAMHLNVDDEIAAIEWLARNTPTREQLMTMAAISAPPPEFENEPQQDKPWDDCVECFKAQREIDRLTAERSDQLYGTAEAAMRACDEVLIAAGAILVYSRHTLTSSAP